MSLLPQLLKVAGALAIATILRHPETFPPPGAGLYFFLGTFAWPLLFVPLLLWQRRGTLATTLRVLELPLLAWTSLMVWFGAGMDPGKATYTLVVGAVLYGVGTAWADMAAWRTSPKPARS